MQFTIHVRGNHWTGLVDWTTGLNFFPLFTKYLGNLCRYYTMNVEYDKFHVVWPLLHIQKKTLQTCNCKHWLAKDGIARQLTGTTHNCHYSIH